MSSDWHYHFNSGDITALIVATVLLLMMYVPGSLLVHGRLLGVRDLRSVAAAAPWMLSILMGVWVLGIYSLAFAPSWGSVLQDDPGAAAPVFDDLYEMMRFEETRVITGDRYGGGGFLGGLQHVLLNGVIPENGTEGPLIPTRPRVHQLPHLLFVVFQFAVFAGTAVPLGLLFLQRWPLPQAMGAIILWSAAVYAPIAHWIWGDGWLTKQGAVDHAGGLLMVAAGFSALGFLVGARSCQTVDAGGQSDPSTANGEAAAGFGALLVWVMGSVLVGACSLRADGRAAMMMGNTLLSLSATVLAWGAVSRFVGNRNTHRESPAAVVAGLAAIAPASGFIVTPSAAILGLITGALGGAFFGRLQPYLARRPAMMLFCVLGLPAAWGMFMTGLLATSAAGGMTVDHQPVTGWIEQNPRLVQVQCLATATAAGWAFAITGLISVGWSVATGRFTMRGSLPIQGEPPYIGEPPDAGAGTSTG